MAEAAPDRADESVGLAHGTRARITALHQSRTYAGLLDGGPSARLDERLLARLEERCSSSPGAILLAPEPAVGSSTSREGHRPLPAFTCQATLVGPDGELDVLWLQDALALPIDAAVLDRLSTIDFSDVCRPPWWMDA
jgi:hypothetical protein